MVSVPAVLGPGTVRHTPEPGRVRFAMGGLFLLGTWIGLLGTLLHLWTLRIALDSATAGNCFLALTLGMVSARTWAARFGGDQGAAIRGLLVAAGLLAAVSLLALSAVYRPLWLLPPLFGVGMAMGALTSAIAWLLYGTLTVHRAPEILNLAGVSFGAGAVAICFLIWALLDVLALPWMLRLVAALPLIFAALAWKAPIFRYLTLPAVPQQLTWKDTLSPSAVLLALALFFQAANLWTIGGWLALYLSRKFGLTTSISLGILGTFWLALTWGRVLATRLPPLKQQRRGVLLATLACLIGCVFLLKTAETSGAVVGAALLGAGIGALHPLTVGTIADRHPDYHPGLLNGFFSLSFVGSMLVPWLAGHLAVGFGIELIIWIPLAGSLMVLLLLAVFVVETRLTEGAAAA